MDTNYHRAARDARVDVFESGWWLIIGSQFK
jgi:hypothetical protein